MSMTLVLFGVFIILILLGVPVMVCIGLATMSAIAYSGSVPVIVIPQKMFTAVGDSFPLMAVPFFMVAGAIMEKGGISKRLIRVATALIGSLTGGLALVTVMASMFFAAISGSGPATVAAIGAIMIPAMVKQGYDQSFAGATQASAGYIGVIIPPSIPMITYGVVTNTSIGQLFMGGFLPGMCIGLTLMIVAYMTSKKHGYMGQATTKSGDFGKAFINSVISIIEFAILIFVAIKFKALLNSALTSSIESEVIRYFVCLVVVLAVLVAPFGYFHIKWWRKRNSESDQGELWYAIYDAFLSLLMPIIILGGIYGGIFTPTEAANVAVVYGLFVAKFIYKEIGFKDMPQICISSAVSSALVMMLIATAMGFGLLLTREGVPGDIANFFISLTQNPFIFLMIINVLLLIVGTFMETNAAIIILAPIFYPILMKMGIDPVHFGIIMTINLAIGMVTPPLGVNLFVTCGLTKMKIEKLINANWKFLFASIFTLIILTYFPKITLFLPDLISGK